MESPANTAAHSEHPLDLATRLEALGEGRFAGRIPETYSNFIGPFGGVLAAALLRAPCEHPARLGDPLALTVNFGGPVAPAPFEIAARATRTNRSSQHWTMEMQQGEDIPLTASAVFAHRRETWSTQESDPPPVPAPAEVPSIPGEGLPAWVANYDIRVVSGGMSLLADPPRDQASSETLLWVRDRPARALDFAALAALSDAFFPRLYVRRPRMVPVGTVSLTTYFHADSAELARCGGGFLLGRVRGQRFNKGFFDHSGALWAEDGTLLATTHQVVYYKE